MLLGNDIFRKKNLEYVVIKLKVKIKARNYIIVFIK